MYLETKNQKVMKKINFFRNGLQRTITILFSGIKTDSSNENSLINDEILEIINNPSDKKKLDEAVDYLLNHKNDKEKDVELSNKTITISLG